MVLLKSNKYGHGQNAKIKIVEPSSGDTRAEPTSEDTSENSADQKRKRPDNDQQLITVDTSRARSNAPVLKLCIESLGWKECSNGRDDGKPCDIHWHAIVYPDMRDIVSEGRVNKFPGMAELAKKISLTRALSAMQKLFPDQFDFYPRSWFIPAQLHEFYEDYYAECAKSDGASAGNRWYIAKPDDGAQGENIYLFQNPTQLQNLDRPQVVQQYVNEPYLMQDKLKFDLRIYCVVRSLNPLTIYVAREGMARFCTVKYRMPSAGNAARTYMHLTNYSLNKQNHQAFVQASSTTDQGSKRLLSSVFHQMEARNVDTRKIWHDIKLIIVKTVLALVPEMIIHYEHQYSNSFGPQCFQILGFDIILDKNQRPILLEINACPSLSIDHIDEQNNQKISVIDEAIKMPLVRDTLLLVMNRLQDQRRVPFANQTNQQERKRSSDDSDPTLGQRSCLSEIFPAQFGYTCAPLLVLDKAAYLYMQCVTIRRTIEISMSGCRHFVKKCGLNDVASVEVVDTLYSQLSSSWASQYTQGLPFYGFVEMLMILATRKYPKANNLLESFRQLLQHCESQIRYHGVRSSRLRADAIEDPTHHMVRDLYLLPNQRKGPYDHVTKKRSSSSVSLPKI